MRCLRYKHCNALSCYLPATRRAKLPTRRCPTTPQARARGNIESQLGACYQVPDTMTKQVLSTVPSPPKMRFGTGKRPGLAEKTDAPGPGAYRLKSGMGALTWGWLKCGWSGGEAAEGSQMWCADHLHRPRSPTASTPPTSPEHNRTLPPSVCAPTSPALPCRRQLGDHQSLRPIHEVWQRLPRPGQPPLHLRGA